VGIVIQPTETDLIRAAQTGDRVAFAELVRPEYRSAFRLAHGLLQDVDEAEAHCHVRKATFVPAPTTYLAGLGWLPDAGAFVDECLLVPTMDLASVAIDAGELWGLDFHPQSPEKTPLDSYRVPLNDLATRPEAGCRTTG
jgi:hypothetical protein